MAKLSISKILESGLTSTLSDCDTDGDEFANSGIEILRFKNDHASQAYNITIVAQATSIDHKSYGTLTKGNVVKAISAGETVNKYFHRYPSPLPPALDGSKSVKFGSSAEMFPFGLDPEEPFDIQT